MIIEPGAYTYETMPDYTDDVPGAAEVVCTRDEVGLVYTPNVVYASPDGHDLTLQLITPSIAAEPRRRFPAVAFVQGSAWGPQNIFRKVPYLGLLARRGYVCAIVEYRHSGIAHFPAQIVDAKNAVRYLRDHADEFNVDANRIAIMGDSSGGHVASIAGMTARSGELDDPASGASCDVGAIISLYGAVDPTLPYGFPTTLDHQLPTSPEGRLMGFDIRAEPERALPAVARTYAERDFAPMLLLHGTKDKTVFCQESVDLYQALKAAGKDAKLVLLRGAEHGDAAFWREDVIDRYDAFLTRCLR